MRIESYRTDAKKEIEGAWVDIGDGGRLLIARVNNAKYNARLRELTKPHTREIRLGVFSVEKQQAILVQTLADTILLDWSGIDDKAGNPVAYTKDQAIKYLSDMPDFREMVVEL